MQPSRNIARLIEIMAALRTPVTGCPWDLEQDFASIAPYTIEEAYEVADAIERGNLEDLREELGDLLLQVVYHARLADEQGAFSFGDVVEAVTRKMIRRHPHVFGDAEARNAGLAKGMWEKMKAEEKRSRSGVETPSGLLEDVPRALPALTRALKLQAKAGRVGFDWGAVGPVFDKLEEEIDELRRAMTEETNQEAIEDELGDVLFVIVNLARHLKVDPERALSRTNAKFTRRFGHIENSLASQGRRPEDATLAEMEVLWQQAKKR